MLESQQKLLSTVYKPINKDIDDLRNEYEKQISNKNIIINELLKKVKILTNELNEYKMHKSSV